MLLRNSGFTVCILACAGIIASGIAQAADGQAGPELPLRVGTFQQQVHLPFTVSEGLPSNNVLHIQADSSGSIRIATEAGHASFREGRWRLEDAHPLPEATWYESLAEVVPGQEAVRAVAEHQGEIAVAAENGLFIGDGTTWALALPQQGPVRWAPVDVRAVAYDAEGRLWFACPQGVGLRLNASEWLLFTGAEGLPYNDFTCMAAGPKGVWFGTTNGAIRYADGNFEFRQGRRWLLENHVRGIALDGQGDAWIATAAGVSHITTRPTTLSEKALFFREEIDRYHRRTRFGYVNPAKMAEPGNKSTAVPEASDNDGHFTGLYLGAVSLGYAATGDAQLRQDAVRAFQALRFLSTVTEGGTHPAPRGFIARAIEPTDGPDPNLKLNPETDRLRRETRDKLWKIIDPRWPIDESGEWYWKCDSSSDELDGYYFGFGIYFDRVCETEAEKEEVRVIVRSMTDHLITHGYNMVDHDGLPTRWGHFSPDDLNRNGAWWVERGLNSWSILTYLLVAHHITHDQKYRDAYLQLAWDEGYAMNGMTQPKVQLGPGSFGQADDNMAFMNYYHLLRYETDPELLSMYRNGVYYHYHLEFCERNPFFNFVYAAGCLNQVRVDQWATVDLSPPNSWVRDSVDTLRRYPLDLVDWPMSNAHRIDMVPLPPYTRGPGTGHQGKGSRVTGTVFPIDESHAVYWGDDPWALTGGGDGTRLREGVPFLLAYYMGLVHGYIED